MVEPILLVSYDTQTPSGMVLSQFSAQAVTHSSVADAPPHCSLQSSWQTSKSHLVHLLSFLYPWPACPSFCAASFSSCSNSLRRSKAKRAEPKKLFCGWVKAGQGSQPEKVNKGM